VIKAADIPKKFDSKLEERFWFYLAAEKQAGKIRDFKYHSMKFKVGGTVEIKGAQESWYTPDFSVETLDREIVLYDTKGYSREAAMVRIRAAQLLHPFRFVIVRFKEKQWAFETVRP